MAAILLSSTTLAILFVGIPENVNIAYAGDDLGTSTIDQTSAQVFQATQNNGCDKLDGDATWCVWNRSNGRNQIKSSSQQNIINPNLVIIWLFVFEKYSEKSLFCIFIVKDVSDRNAYQSNNRTYHGW